MTQYIRNRRREDNQEIAEMMKFLKEFNFKYQQHAENKIIELLIEYPSLKKELEEAGKNGVETILIGEPEHSKTKPFLAIKSTQAIFHVNN